MPDNQTTDDTPIVLPFCDAWTRIRDPEEMRKQIERWWQIHDQPMTWAALHRKDGRELTEEDAPGYRRAPNSDAGWSFGEAPDDWGWVHFVSLWDAPIGGNVISDPPLQSARMADGGQRLLLR